VYKKGPGPCCVPAGFAGAAAWVRSAITNLPLPEFARIEHSAANNELFELDGMPSARFSPGKDGLPLMDDKYPSTDDHQPVRLDYPYPDAAR